MCFHFVDYSSTYFNTIAKEPPPKKRSGKFVQIINHSTDDEYLVLSPKELSVYHANIVERFFSLNGNIPGSYNAKKDYFNIYDPDWEVIGGGLWVTDEENKTITLNGESKMYGKFDGSGLKKKIATVDGMALYAVIVNGK